MAVCADCCPLLDASLAEVDATASGSLGGSDGRSWAPELPAVLSVPRGTSLARAWRESVHKGIGVSGGRGRGGGGRNSAPGATICSTLKMLAFQMRTVQVRCTGNTEMGAESQHRLVAPLQILLPNASPP